MTVPSSDWVELSISLSHSGGLTWEQIAYGVISQLSSLSQRPFTGRGTLEVKPFTTRGTGYQQEGVRTGMVSNEILPST